MDISDLLDSIVGDFYPSLGLGAAGACACESPDVEEVFLSLCSRAEERDVIDSDFLTSLDGT